MAREEKVWEYIRQAGYEPLEDRCIIVRAAPGDLSEKIATFFRPIIKCDFCVLQMCKNELILLPFDQMWTYLKKEVSMVVSYADIRSLEVKEDLLNFVITIRTKEDVIRLSTQQKALSDWRMSGLNATQFVGGYKNWHKENVNETLKALTALGDTAAAG